MVQQRRNQSVFIKRFPPLQAKHCVNIFSALKGCSVNVGTDVGVVGFPAYKPSNNVPNCSF